MAQLVIATAGAAVGSFFGPLGTQIGWAVGSMVGATFGPTQRVKGPRLEDLRVTGTEYGQPIPWVAGHPRVAGQVWWASDRREISTTTEQGKGGGGGVSQTTYTYEVDILFGLCDRPIDYVARIWSNGNLVWTALTDGDAESLASSQAAAPWDELVVLAGAADQLPWSTYEAAVGVGNAPAYRGRGAVGISRLQLGGSGVIPNLTFEVVVDGVLTFADFGVLCQFDTLTDATHVQSDLGPDFVISGAQALDSGTAVFGSSVSTDGGAVNTGTDVVLDITDKAWRVETWVRPQGTGRIFMLDDPAGTYRLEITLNNQVVTSVFQYNWVSNVASGGGATAGAGKSTVTFTLPTWIHVAAQYDPATKYIDVFAAGRWYGRLGNGVGVPFTGNAFTRLTLGQIAAGANFDSTLYRYFNDDEGDLLYSTGGYVVPTGPFEPPPYAYVTVDPNDETLRSVVDALCARAGMPAGTWDSSALAAITTPVRAFSIAQTGSTRAALEQLMAAYFFEAYSTDRLYFVPRAGAAALTVDADDLGSGLDGPADERLPLLLGNDLEVPAQVSLSYSNVDADYTTATEHSDRLLSGQASTSAVQMPLGMTSAEAKGIADAILVDGLASRVSGSMALPMDYSRLVPTDVVTVPDDDGNTYRARIVRRTDAGPLVTMEWVLDDATAIESAGITSTDYASTVTVALPGDTTMALLDIPLLRDADDTLGHYVAATSSATTWPGASIQRSTDGLEYSEAASIGERAVIGVTTTALGNWSGGHVFDELNSVTVSIGSATLSSSTREAMLADLGVNAMLVGSEIIRFRDATLSTPGVYVLTGLLRGQRGTEWAMTGHGNAERVVLLRTAGLRYVSIDLPSVSATRYYKGVTRGRALDSADQVTLACQAVSSMPFAPVDVRHSRNAVGGFDIEWKRRTRLSTSFCGPGGIVVPLGESAEAYEIDVMDGASVVRTIQSSSASCAYTPDQQSADFGVVQAAVDVRIYQVGVAGRGRAASATLSSDFTPVAQEDTITLGGSFASGVLISVYVDNDVLATYTTAAGDVDLEGVAASLAAVIDAVAGYAAEVDGGDPQAVIVTGPVGRVYALSVNVSGGSAIAHAITTAAESAGPPTSDVFHVRVVNTLGTGTGAIPVGTWFGLTVFLGGPLPTLRHTVEFNPQSAYQVLSGIQLDRLSNAVKFNAYILYALTLQSAQTDYYLRIQCPPGVVGHTMAWSATPPYALSIDHVAIASPGSTVSVAQVSAITVAGTVAAGESFTVTVDGTGYSYTAIGGDTSTDVATELAALIDAGPHAASASGPVITLTGGVAGDDVAVTVGVQRLTTVTIN